MPQITKQTLKVLVLFLHNTSLYALQVCKLTSLPYGTVQPILKRFEKAGWLVATQEDVDSSEVRRKARIYYTLTTNGRVFLLNEIDELRGILDGIT